MSQPEDVARIRTHRTRRGVRHKPIVRQIDRPLQPGHLPTAYLDHLYRSPPRLSAWWHLLGRCLSSVEVTSLSATCIRLPTSRMMSADRHAEPERHGGRPQRQSRCRDSEAHGLIEDDCLQGREAGTAATHGPSVTKAPMLRSLVTPLTVAISWAMSGPASVSLGCRWNMLIEPQALCIDTGQRWTYLLTTGMESPATPSVLMTPAS